MSWKPHMPMTSPPLDISVHLWTWPRESLQTSISLWFCCVADRRKHPSGRQNGSAERRRHPSGSERALANCRGRPAGHEGDHPNRRRYLSVGVPRLPLHTDRPRTPKLIWKRYVLFGCEEPATEITREFQKSTVISEEFPNQLLQLRNNDFVRNSTMIIWNLQCS